MNLNKYKIAIPSMVTSLSILCGLFAMFICASEPSLKQLMLACWLIILASIMDGLDGKVARLTRTSSEFGIQFDSIADIITFGVAASIISYKFIFQAAAVKSLIFYIFPVMYLIFGAIRLARFNITATTKTKKGFIGLPIPVAAGAMASLFLTFTWLDSHLVELSSDLKLRISTFFIVILSFLMVSQVPYNTLNLFFFGGFRKNPFRSVVNLCIFIVLVKYPSLGFFALAVFYILHDLLVSIKEAVTGDAFSA